MSIKLELTIYKVRNKSNLYDQLGISTKKQNYLLLRNKVCAQCPININRGGICTGFDTDTQPSIFQPEAIIYFKPEEYPAALLVRAMCGIGRSLPDNAKLSELAITQRLAVDLDIDI
jgi:hypothetical protein